jgi:hypothetical protein
LIILELRAADTDSVLHRALVLAAFVCCGLVLVSFTLFARDQLAGASAHQQNSLVSGSAKAPPAQHRGQPRRFIDGAAHDLISPFSAIVGSNNDWVTRGVPSIFALLVYGVGLGYLARFSSGMS